ncbi:MAG: lipoate--protein ligase family protein [Pedosphaera sp.]|nr:lipoate--protein ligase family protein [Pedosphaera sp.]
MTLLDLTLPSPAENLACDEALLDAAESGASGEVLRFWESPDYFVVVGYANKVATEVNVAACAARGIPILRRCSGGGTVVQGPGCLNYALALRINPDGPTRNISSANQFIMERNRAAIKSALRTPHSALRIQGHTDLTLDGLKFSGNSQRRRKHFLLFHGTFLLDFDLAIVVELLRHPSHEPGYRASRKHGEFVANLNAPGDLVKDALREAWTANEKLQRIPAKEIERLVIEKYSTTGWNRKF